MHPILAWSLKTITSTNWLEVVNKLAAVATAIIAALALRNWQKQDKAKRKADFLDALVETAHAYIAEVSKPITILQMAKIGMESHAPSQGSSDKTDATIKGAIAYIQKQGEQNAKRLLDALETCQPTVIKLRSLIAKGQVFDFKNYARCRNAVITLTWHFDRIEAFAVMMGSPTFNWDNPDVLKLLKMLIVIDPEEIRGSVRENNITLLEFAADAYKKIYG